MKKITNKLFGWGAGEKEGTGYFSDKGTNFAKKEIREFKKPPKGSIFMVVYKPMKGGK